MFKEVPAKFIDQFRQRCSTESISELRRHPAAIRYSMVAMFCWRRQQQCTDSLIDLLLQVIHNLGARAEKKIDKKQFVAFKKIRGKTRLLFKLAEATVDQPEGIVKEVVYPVVPKKTLEELCLLYTSIFDLDHAKAMIWEDAGLPAPNLIVRNRQSGHSHLYYAIPPVCTTEAARSKPIAYMKAVYEAFAARLDADTDFHSGPVAKTPGHPWWLTHELHAHVYELGELADYVDLAVSSPWGKGPQFDEVSHSRHCILFEHLRHYAYSIVNRERERGSFATFTRLLEAYAHSRNSFQKLGFMDNLAQSSLKATVKSVARWTWDRYTGCGRCHRGVMPVSYTHLDVYKRQGQQCTAILHMLLLENVDPLLMDQPEDNLDNAFIADRIVAELREAKTCLLYTSRCV